MLIPLSWNSFPWAAPISYIKVLLNVAAVLIAACHDWVWLEKRTPAGPSCKQIPGNPLSTLGSIEPTHFPFIFSVLYNNNIFSSKV